MVEALSPNVRSVPNQGSCKKVGRRHAGGDLGLVLEVILLAELLDVDLVHLGVSTITKAAAEMKYECTGCS